MPKFQFRLATLLRLYETTRDERRVELAEVQRVDAEIDDQLTRLAGQRSQLHGERRSVAGPGTVNLPRLVDGQQYAVVLRAQEIELRRRRQILICEIERRRQALIEADRELRTLEKLRESQSQAHRQEADRQESKRLDETALLMKQSCWSSGE